MLTFIQNTWRIPVNYSPRKKNLKFSRGALESISEVREKTIHLKHRINYKTMEKINGRKKSPKRYWKHEQIVFRNSLSDTFFGVLTFLLYFSLFNFWKFEWKYQWNEAKFVHMQYLDV